MGSTSADYIGRLVGRMQSGRVKNGRFAGTIGASTSSALKTAGLFIGYIEGGNVELGDRLEHHIGAYYSNNRDFSLYQMGSFVKQTNRFFYEELEEGVLTVGNSNIHHFAASKTGDPVRGYLVTVPSVDYGTLSVMESQNNYAKEINWANPGAIAAGTRVLVYTSPVNDTESDPPVYYELEPGSLTWVSDDGGKHEEINAEASDIFFTMPDENITVSAKYRAMTNGVILSQDKLVFGVEQIRSGSRWNPQIAWKITDPVQLTATVVPDSAANKNVVWNVKDTDGSSTDVISVDDKGTVTVNREAKWIQDLIKAGVTNQELYPSKPIMTEGKNYASVTVTTEAGQVDKKNLTFSVEKIMEGNRLNPSVRYVVTPPQKLNAVIAPDQGGSVEVNQDSAWIQDLNGASGSAEATVVAAAEDGEIQGSCKVVLRYKTTDRTYSSSGSSGGGGGGGSSSSGSGRPKAVTEAGPAGAWLQDNTGWWFRYADGSYPKNAWVRTAYGYQIIPNNPINVVGCTAYNKYKDSLGYRHSDYSRTIKNRCNKDGFGVCLIYKEAVNQRWVDT